MLLALLSCFMDFWDKTHRQHNAAGQTPVRQMYPEASEGRSKGVLD